LSKRRNSNATTVGVGYEQNPRYAILVTDMLNDFIHGKLKCQRAKRIIPKIRFLLDKGRQKGIPIFYCNDEHLSSDTYELELWGPHAMKGTDGAKIIDELKPTVRDLVVTKRTYSSFDSKSLERSLGQEYDGRGVGTLILTGIHTHICVKHTAYDAFVRGFNVIVAEDGVEAFTEKDHMAGLEYMKRNYGTRVMKVSRIIKNIN
jgi:nicotinamidase-related amidase